MLRTKEQVLEYLGKYWNEGELFYIPLIYSSKGVQEDIANSFDEEVTFTETDFDDWADRMDKADWSWAYDISIDVGRDIIKERDN